MTTPILTALDSISAKVKDITGIKMAYTATGGGVTDSGLPIPESMDDTPVAITWIGSGELQAGNAEHLEFLPVVMVWVSATNAGWAYKTLAQFPDLVVAAFRSGITLGGTVTECKLTGWDAPITETNNGGQVYLGIPFNVRVVIDTMANNLYSV